MEGWKWFFGGAKLLILFGLLGFLLAWVAVPAFDFVLA
jgi:hypothetical protein